MGFLNFFLRTDINAGVRKCREDPAGILLDVRNPEEFAHRRIPGSQNLPLPQIQSAPSVFPEKDAHLYIYCYSGARSGRATSALKRMGYTNVTDIGGIKSYQGETERGAR